MMDLTKHNWNLYSISTNDEGPVLTKLKTNITSYHDIFDDYVWKHNALMLGRQKGRHYSFLENIESSIPVKVSSTALTFTYKRKKYKVNDIIEFDNKHKFYEEGYYNRDSRSEQYIMVKNADSFSHYTNYRSPVPTTFKFRIRGISSTSVKLEGYKRNWYRADKTVLEKFRVNLKVKKTPSGGLTITDNTTWRH